MQRRKNESAESTALWALCSTLLIFFVILGGCSPDSKTIDHLTWRTLGNSTYKEVVYNLLREDMERAIGYDRDPLRYYYVAAKDINDDGKEELFVTSGLTFVSGVEGSWIGLFSPDANGDWRELSYLLITHYSPRILPTKTNGFHDLAAWNSLVSFEEGAYRRTGDTDFGKIELGKELSIENLLPHIWEQCCSGKE